MGYDAFLLVSFGGPEGPDDVLPFLRNVTRGRGVPEERLAEVAEHYRNFGGVSPINAQCRELLAAISKAFGDAAIDLPLYWGNRNWQPMIADTVARMRDGGARRYQAQLEEVAALVTAAAAPDLGYDLVWQSRSGPPQVPWLEPDVNDHLATLAAAGTTSVVVSPIGFISDHLEVAWDLDNEAAGTAKELGLHFARAATPGTDPRFVGMIRE